MSGPQASLLNEGFNNLALVTARIEMFTAATKGGTATGFFFATADQRRLFLITNRHVVKNEGKLFFPDRLKVRLHVDRKDLKAVEIP